MFLKDLFVTALGEKRWLMEEETSKNKCYLFPTDPLTPLPLSFSDAHLLFLFVLN